MNIVDKTQIMDNNRWKKIMKRFARTFDGIMKCNYQSYEKFKKFILEIIADLISKNQPNHGNHHTSQQR